MRNKKQVTIGGINLNKYAGFMTIALAIQLLVMLALGRL